MTGQLAPGMLHWFSGHDGPPDACQSCAAVRADCHGRVRFESLGEAVDWLRELHERRQVAPAMTVVECGWCGMWHVPATVRRRRRTVPVRRWGRNWTMVVYPGGR